MGRLHIPAEDKINGPWLLKREDLDELNNIVEGIDSKLRARFPSAGKNKEVVLKSSDGKHLEDSSIKGILKDPKVKDFSPKELYVHLEINPKNDFKFTITTDEAGELEYIIKCSEEDIIDEIKYDLDNWIEKNRPKKVLYWWSQLRSAVWVLGALVLLVMYTSLYDTENYTTYLHKDARNLLDTGINSNNSQRAIELLLKLQTGYTPRNFIPKETLDQPYLIKTIIATLIVIILSFGPVTTLGIGRHKFRLKFFKFWIWGTITFIPTTIFLPKLIEAIQKYI